MKAYLYIPFSAKEHSYVLEYAATYITSKLNHDPISITYQESFRPLSILRQNDKIYVVGFFDQNNDRITSTEKPFNKDCIRSITLQELVHRLHQDGLNMNIENTIYLCLFPYPEKEITDRLQQCFIESKYNDITCDTMNVQYPSSEELAPIYSTLDEDETDHKENSHKFAYQYLR